MPDRNESGVTMKFVTAAMWSNLSAQIAATMPSTDMKSDAATAWKRISAGEASVTGTTTAIAAQTTNPTTRPRVTPPKARPSVSSSGLRGGISISTMLPWNFAIMSEEVVLAKAFCTIAIMMSPGARKARKGTPATLRCCPDSAKRKIARNRSVVTTGAAIVCMPTLTKRRTSRS